MCVYKLRSYVKKIVQKKKVVGRNKEKKVEIKQTENNSKKKTKPNYVL